MEAKTEIIRCDSRTEKWFRERCCMDVETTLMKCEACGLYYKPSLGHACKKKGGGKNE